MHIFLTGAMQIGKSTVIGKTMALLPQKLGGYRTVSSEPDADGNRSVHLVAVGGQPSDENRVGVRFAGHGCRADPDAFDRLGCEALSRPCELILMDEIGVMEKSAHRLSESILQRLDGSVPVLGVLQKRAETPLARAIREHPSVTLVEVTEENREKLPETLARMLTNCCVSFENMIE